MRKAVIILSFLTTLLISCEQKEDKIAEQTLREFYTQYITECEKIPHNEDAFVSIKQNFLTKELIQKLEMAQLDYDPLLNAQDCDKAWVETLEIHRVKEKKNTYQICYSYNDIDGQHRNCVTLSLLKIDGKYLINDIENFPGDTSVDDELYTSDIRPNETLELGTIYTDHFEYIDYRDGEYLNLIVLKKDNKEISLFDDCPQDDKTISALKAGDMVEVKWKLDSSYHEGYGKVWIGEYAEKITKISINYDSLYQTSISSDLKNYKLYHLKDTIVQDMNGDNSAEKIFFNENKNIIIIDGKTNTHITFDDDGFSEFHWVDFWGIITDKETYRMFYDKNGVLDEEKVPLLYPSIFIRKYESGGGIITFNNEKYIWIHQND